jgi:hypothetical protein
VNAVERQEASATAAIADSLLLQLEKEGSPRLPGDHAVSFCPYPQLQMVADALETNPSHGAEAAALVGQAAYRRRDYAMPRVLGTAIAVGPRPPEDHLVLTHTLIVQGRMTSADSAVEGRRGSRSGAVDPAWAGRCSLWRNVLMSAARSPSIDRPSHSLPWGLTARRRSG